MVGSGLGVSVKNYNLGVLINWILWVLPTKLELTRLPPKIATSGEYILYITRSFPDITTVRLGGLQVPSSRIDFVREIIISYYRFGYSQVD